MRKYKRTASSTALFGRFGQLSGIKFRTKAKKGKAYKELILR